MELRRLLAEQRVEVTAPLLLGATLVTRDAVVQIVEVEAYGGADDPGSHAHRRQSPKNATMFGPPGHAYVYFTYGNHWMLNVVAHPLGDPGAILIRGALPLQGIEALRPRRPKAKNDRDLLSGPGKITAALAVDRSHDAIDLLEKNSRLYLVPSKELRPYRISTRIGLAEGKGEHTPWRFVDAELDQYASRPHPKTEIILPPEK